MNRTKETCECGEPIDRTLPGHELQCRRCYELNGKVHVWHLRTQEAQILDADEWRISQARQRTRKWFRRHRNFIEIPQTQCQEC